MTEAAPTPEASAPAFCTVWQLARYMLALGTWGFSGCCTPDDARLNSPGAQSTTECCRRTN